jgi:hypothetical protein
MNGFHFRRFAGRTWLLFGTLCMLLLLVVAGTTTFLAAHAASAQPAVTAPASTRSYYESSANSGTLHSQGCSAAKGPSGVVVLDFGEPAYSDGYGTIDFANGFVSDTAILHAAANFALGIWQCRPRSAHFITVAIGTSNYGSHVEYNAGTAWGNMISSVEHYIITSKYNSALGADGAIDAETEWNSFSATSNFVNGYNHTNNKRWLWDYGDDTPGYWTDYQVWYISYGAGDERVLPEIYYNADATQDWAAVAQWACSTGRHMLFVGAMAEAVNGTNSPTAAFDALYNALGTNACTKTDRSSMTHATDI